MSITDFSHQVAGKEAAGRLLEREKEPTVTREDINDLLQALVGSVSKIQNSLDDHEGAIEEILRGLKILSGQGGHDPEETSH